MSSPIEFYFDFSSPYGYLASKRIDEIAKAHDRSVSWHPIVLGFIFRITNSRPLVDHPIKGDYAKMDMARSAREHHIQFSLPEPFPINTVSAARAILWMQSLEQNNEQARSTALIHALYDAYFVDNIDISQTELILATAESQGVDRKELSAALQDENVKALLKQATDVALQKQVFGSPFMIVEGEQFWGSDRLEQLDRWLATGGW